MIKRCLCSKRERRDKKKASENVTLKCLQNGAKAFTIPYDRGCLWELVRTPEAPRTRSSLLWSHTLEHRKGRERLPDLANEFPLANRPSLPTRKQMFPLESHRKAACCAVSYKARGSKNQYWYSGGAPFGPGARCDAYMELAKLGLECELRFGWFFPCLACVCPGRLDGGGERKLEDEAD